MASLRDRGELEVNCFRGCFGCIGVVVDVVVWLRLVRFDHGIGRESCLPVELSYGYSPIPRKNLHLDTKAANASTLKSTLLLPPDYLMDFKFMYLQKRVLNFSRGPAVRALWAQTDKREYALEMKKVTRNLSIREAMLTEILLGKNDKVEGVRTFFGMSFYAPSVVLTTGTFRSGKIWVGRASMAAGRAGESASLGHTENLQHLGFETDSLCFPFSYFRLLVVLVALVAFDPDFHIEREQVCCYLKVTHQLIKDNLHETPTYDGLVEAKGPRYCPSIEDKCIGPWFSVEGVEMYDHTGPRPCKGSQSGLTERAKKFPWLFWILTCLYRGVTIGLRDGSGATEGGKPRGAQNAKTTTRDSIDSATELQVVSPGGNGRRVRFGAVEVVEEPDDGGRPSQGADDNDEEHTPSIVNDDGYYDISLDLDSANEIDIPLVSSMAARDTSLRAIDLLSTDTVPILTTIHILAVAHGTSLRAIDLPSTDIVLNLTTLHLLDVGF
ncbi:hypothetical protein Sjap_014918 [Stephania japonica]|uniref:MnmG N-terminal domain-containing protein n=1 Tax=Stephania japonica TaxID=461633 RepID=A0AAP0II60_9MAGN